MGKKAEGRKEGKQGVPRGVGLNLGKGEVRAGVGCAREAGVTRSRKAGNTEEVRKESEMEKSVSTLWQRRQRQPQEGRSWTYYR
jgi:hypothetical protein